MKEKEERQNRSREVRRVEGGRRGAEGSGRGAGDMPKSWARVINDELKGVLNANLLQQLTGVP